MEISQRSLMLVCLSVSAAREEQGFVPSSCHGVPASTMSTWDVHTQNVPSTGTWDVRTHDVPSTGTQVSGTVTFHPRSTTLVWFFGQHALAPRHACSSVLGSPQAPSRCKTPHVALHPTHGSTPHVALIPSNTSPDQKPDP